MSHALHALFGLLIMGIGALKTWMHMGTITVVALPTCNGKTVTLALGPSNWLEQAHCWGCYAFAFGLALVALALFRQFRERRSVAYGTD
ncbi:MAG: hypothetical protein AAFO74_08050 [Pseudomonadota bacterium]